ncbi:coagulation factor IX-like isoform X2 [Pseudoliparis swirei]|uniref:coagulation factor IX-like isoform X2 n=1 Tax=Pseudoliparis swirei TaxID=2059687 RepID=UPI0024BE3300|nr:coagulation factor IX-like isoform X2 [Pseudoliparis swirei]
MAGVCLLAFIAGLLLETYGLPVEIKEKDKEAVFVSQQTADTVLHRLRRYNSGLLEEMMQKDNLERECKEETCTLEEAREVFEDNGKTMAFWAVNIDGDQCRPPPCHNEGVCEDGIGAYVCYCKPNFSGKNCEIERKQWSVHNGGCSHFCVIQAMIPVCRCAAGYRLGPDKKTCEPTEQFSCGRLNTPASSATSSITPQSSNSSYTLDDDYKEDISQVYDYYDEIPTEDSDLSNISVAVNNRSVRSALSSSVKPEEASSVFEKLKKLLPSWAFFPPTITAQDNTDQRIVGGDEANFKGIPWQVALMAHPTVPHRAKAFCGGSLLSELWVATAASCLQQVNTNINFFIRVGEHDVDQDEGNEQDRAVVEMLRHPMYNPKKSLYNHDIALLKLASPVELSNQRRPICLGPKDFTETILRESINSLVSGWGKLDFNGRQSPTLKKLEVPYVDRTACKASSREQITRYMFCSGFRNGNKDACQGDSGGPHATNYKGTWFLTGIISWGEECALEGKYGVYTRVSRYHKWISLTTGIPIDN